MAVYQKDSVIFGASSVDFSLSGKTLQTNKMPHFLFCDFLVHLSPDPRSPAVRRLQRLHHKRVGRLKGNAHVCSFWPREPCQQSAGVTRWHRALHGLLGQHFTGELEPPCIIHHLQTSETVLMRKKEPRENTNTYCTCDRGRPGDVFLIILKEEDRMGFFLHLCLSAHV